MNRKHFSAGERKRKLEGKTIRVFPSNSNHKIEKVGKAEFPIFSFPPTPTVGRN